jgi:hypothetical protein
MPSDKPCTHAIHPISCRTVLFGYIGVRKPSTMLLQHLPHLAERRIVLASASPRRKELLSKLGLKFEVSDALWMFTV